MACISGSEKKKDPRHAQARQRTVVEVADRNAVDGIAGSSIGNKCRRHMPEGVRLDHLVAQHFARDAVQIGVGEVGCELIALARCDGFEVGSAQHPGPAKHVGCDGIGNTRVETYLDDGSVTARGHALV